MQATLKIITTLAVLGAAIIGILVVLNIISDVAARDVLIKTAWVLAIIGIASFILILMNGPGQK